MISKLLKEPLVQFLLIALILLGGERWINAEDYAYDQYLNQDQTTSSCCSLCSCAPKPLGQTRLRPHWPLCEPDERQRLVDDYARDEVLFREAMALNLDNNDQIIRRRLIQKMDYLAQGFYDEAAPLTEQDLRDYYAGTSARSTKKPPKPPLPMYLFPAKNAALRKQRRWQRSC